MESSGYSRHVARVGDDPALRAFGVAARSRELLPGWEFVGGIPNEPVAAERAHRWSWTESLRPAMVEAYDVVDPIKAERRNLIMVNPGLERVATTRTLLAAIQGVLPGEIAPAHRHTAGALRFMIEGRGAFTVVDGTPCFMDPAALVLTPQWCWHDHANETDQPVIWLDVLDVPFVMDLNQWFFELYSAETQPRSAVTGEQLVYPWEPMEAALRERAAGARGDGGVTVEYTNPATGGPVMPTIGCAAHLLRPGGATRPRRTNASAVLHVVRGRGRTVVGDRAIEWETGDVLAIPHWLWTQHENASTTEPAFLFSATDTPILRTLGLLRDQIAGSDGHA